MQKMKKALLAFLFSVIAVVIFYGIFTHVSNEKKIDQKQNLLLQELHNNKGEYDEKIIVLNKTTHSQAKEFAEKIGAKLRINKQGNFAALTLPEGSDITEVLSSDVVRKYIDSICLDYYVSVALLDETYDDGVSGEYEYVSKNVNYTVNDPRFSSQEYLPYINVGNAWNTTKGDGVTIAVIDTGIDYDHDEFNGRISEYSYNATYDKIVKDHDFSVIDDEHGHGTAVAGVISAALNNSVGVAGIAPEAELLVIKCEANEDGDYNSSDLTFGIYYAIERDVDVINMSFGGPSDSHADALELAYDSDIVCVASAGNDGTSALNYPAANEYVIGVGACISNDGFDCDLAYYSNYGDNTDVVAVGTCHTTLKDNEYGYAQGTSLSCPQVTAAVALYLSENQYATVDQVKEILFASTVDVGDLGKDFYFGYGLLDINALVCEKKGTVTYNMLTDELENTTGKFVYNHALQNIPEPERRYAVFDGWYYDIYCTEPLDLYRDKWNANITLYAGWANEDDGIPYSYVVLDDETVEIKSYNGKRRYITVPDMIDGMEVSSIGEAAFANNQKLCGVTLPQTLTKISNQAFSGCNNLRSIEIPDNVVFIGEEAFKDTPRLKTIDISSDSSLTTIEKFAFRSSAIEEFYIPAGLQELGGSAFFGCNNLSKFKISSNSKYFKIYDDVLYNYTLSCVVAFPTGNSDIKDIKLPDDTKKVLDYAFANAPIESIDLNNVMEIRGNAFNNAKLREVNIPDSVQEVGVAAFKECTLLEMVTIGKGVAEIKEETFDGCSELPEIIIPQNIVKIGKSAFASTGIQNLIFEENSKLAYIGNSAFSASKISQLTIPKSVMKIMSNAFFNCGSLENVSFEAGIDLKIIDTDAFKGAILLKSFIIPDSVETIKSGVFANSGLEAITIPKNVTSIDYGVFTGCDALSAISVDEANEHYTSVDGVLYSKDKTKLVSYAAGKTGTSYSTLSTTLEIERQAFAEVSKLSSITLNEGLTFIGVEAFRSTNLSYVTIPSSVEQISRFAFQNTAKLTSVNIPSNSNLKRLGYGAFAETSISSFKIPANVSTLGQGVFLGCKKLTSVTFLANSLVESLPAYTFNGAENLTTIRFENGSSLKSIQARALYGLSKLQTFDLGDAEVENIDNYAFMFCEKLSSIKIPSSTTNIGRFAFFGCNKLTEITIPASVEHIGENAFSANSAIDLYFESETLPLHLDEGWDNDIRGYYVGVTDVIENDNWKYAVTTSGGISIINYLGSEKEINLKEEAFDGDVVSIGGYAFANSEICEIVLPESLKHIYAYAFYTSGISNISVPQSVEFIGKYAFGSSNVESVEFAENSVLKTIESYAFANCYKLASFKFPGSVQVLGTGVLAESSVASLDISALKISEIPENAFMGTKITSVKIPDSVVLINHNAFRNCENLQSVTWGNGENVYLMSNAFYNTGLTELNIPENITYIGEYCFTGLTGLEEITVAENNPKYCSIDGLLYSKDGRKLIVAPAGRTGVLTLPLDVENLGFGAFENSKLTRIEFNPDSNILTFGYRCFYNSEITDFTVPSSVISFDYYAFAMCDNLTEVTFADNSNMRGIYEGAFYGCSKLQKIELPEEVVEISDYAFYGCSKLSKLPISENSEVLGIYDYAFANCNLEEIVIPETVVDIGEYAFMGNDMIAVTVPDTNYKELSIGLGAFAECDSLVYLSVPFIGASFEDDSVTWMSYLFGAGAYTAGKDYIPASLKNISITKNVTFVGEGAFYDFQNLENITLPDSIEKVYSKAFYKCNGKYEFFKPVYFMTGKVTKDAVASSIYRDTHLSNGVSGDLVIADGPKYINDGFVTKVENIDSVTIPKSVISLSPSAFVGTAGSDKHIDVYYKGSLSDWCNITNKGCFAEDYDLYIGGKLVTDVTLPLTESKTLTGGFGGCQSIERVIIPEGTTDILCSAFSKCENIDYVYIPSTCKTVPNGMFNFSNIKNIELAEGVETIEDGALSNIYDGLESIVIPKTLKSLTFMYAIENVYVPDIETFFNLENATFATKNLYVDGKLCEDVTIPDGVTSIRSNLFKGSNSLKSINLEDSKITSIGESAFYGTAIKIADLPDTLETIGSFAFSGCTSLRYVRLPSSLTKIGGNAFWNCSIQILKNESQIAMTGSAVRIEQDGTVLFSGETTENELVYDDNGFVFEKIPTEDGSFRYAMLAYLGKEDEVVLPSSIDGIAYDFNDTLGNTCVYALPSTVTVPKEITDLDELFASWRGGNSSRVKKVILPEDFTSFSSYNFRSTSIESFEFNDSVTEIPDGLFGSCSDLKNVKLPKELKEIGRGAFSGTGIETIEIPESVTKIGSAAFSNCTGIEEITLPSGITVIESELFKNCTSLKSITIPDGVEKIGDYAFSGCTSLEITISKNVSSIGKEAFAGCLAVNVDEENENFVFDDGVLYNKDKTSILWVSPTVTHYTVPATVTSIGTIFKGHSKLESIEFEDGISISNVLPSGAFGGCKALKRVVLPECITNIGSSAFNGADALEEVVLPQGLEIIQNLAFFSCDSLETIDIPDTVTKMGNQCFALSGLKEIDLSRLNVESLGDSYIFYICENLTSVKLPETLKTLDARTFDSCKALKHIDLPEKLEIIGTGVFHSSGITEIQLPETLKEIGIDAFMGCPIKYITIPEGVTTISGQAFLWSGLESIKLPSTLKTIKYKGLAASNLEYLEIPEGVEDVADGAFEYSYGVLKIVKAPSTLKTFPKTNSKSFDEFHYGGTPEQWVLVNDSNTKNSYSPNKIKSFYAEGKLMEDVTVPEGIETIDEKTGLSNIACLKSVTLSSTVKSLGKKAFEKCVSLESITIPAGLESIDITAFSGCNKIKEVIIDENNEHFVVVDGVVYDKDLTKVILVTASANEIVIPNTVTDISNIAGSVGARRVSFESGSSITEITNGEFANCPNLTELILPDSLKTLNVSSLSGSKELISLTIGENVETVTGSVSFNDLGIVYNNSNLDVSSVFSSAYVIENADGTRICEPENEDFEYFYTDDYLFYKLNGEYVMSEYIGSDESITLPMDYDGNPYSIRYVSSGKHIVIPDGDITVGERAFSGHHELESIECHEPEIGEYAFYYISTLKSIKLYDLKRIGTSAFQYTDNLESLYIDGDDAVLERYCFAYCRDSVFDITLDGTFESAYGTFFYDTLNDKYLVDSAYIIDNVLFSTEKNAEYIYAPGLSLVDGNAYVNCKNTAKLVTDPYMLSDFTNLETLVLSGNVSSYMFALDNAPETLSKVIVAENFDADYLKKMSYLKNVTYYVEDDKNESVLSVTGIKWNSGNKVYYGDDWILTQFRDADGKIISMDAVVIDEVIRQPYMESYTDENGIYHKFVGWDVNDDGSADFIPATSATDVFAKAVFKTHNLAEAEIINPTCTVNGRFTQYCADCGECMDDYIIPAIGHERSEFIKEVAASCSARGYTEYKCDVCGETFKTSYVDKKACSYGEYVYTAEPTCEKTGARVRTCEICSGKEYESVPKLPHNYVSTVTRESTCSKEGYITHVCSSCGDTVSESVPTLSHEYVKRKVSKTWLRILIEKLLNMFFGYEGDNVYYYECAKCHYVMTVDDASGKTSVQSVSCRHKSTSEWTLVQEASPKQMGIMVKTCNLCNEYVEALTIDAIICSIKEFTADVSDDSILTNTVVVNVPANGKVFIALYAYTGRLLDVRQANLDEEGFAEVTFDMSDDAYKVKAFVMDEYSNPVCELKEIKVGTAVILDSVEHFE